MTRYKTLFLFVTIDSLSVNGYVALFDSLIGNVSDYFHCLATYLWCCFASMSRLDFLFLLTNPDYLCTFIPDPVIPDLE